MSNRSGSKSTNSSQKEISSVTTKNSVVCVFISGASSGAWVEDLLKIFCYLLLSPEG